MKLSDKNKSLPVSGWRKKEKGATLLEVMVSVFIMAFGIMALMLAQLKSVGAVREAEMQTRVAQAVQNLEEGMLSNPDVRTLTPGGAYSKPVYSSYNTPLTAVAPAAAPLTLATCGAGAAAVARGSLKDCHIAVFQGDLLRALPNATAINYQIATAGGETTITVNWTEASGAETADAFNFSYQLSVGN